MAFDAFLKVGDIAGESSDKAHKEWIEVLSFSWGVSQSAGGSRSSGGAPAGERANVMDFNVTKSMDKTSPALFLSCVQGTSHKKVTLQLHRATDAKDLYAEYLMEDAIITSVVPGGSSGGDLPMESISFNFAKMTMKYVPTDQKTGKPAGAIEKWWSTNENTGG